MGSKGWNAQTFTPRFEYVTGIYANEDYETRMECIAADVEFNVRHNPLQLELVKS